MKERFLNVLAWGVWIGVTGWLVFILGGMATGFVPIDDIKERGDLPLFMAYIAGTAIGPLVVQWVLFYIVTGSPRILPWRRPRQDDGE